MNLYEGYDDESQVGAPTDTTFSSYEEFEAYKSSCLEVIEQAKAAERLATNPDFQAVIMKAYFEDEPARLAALVVSGRLPEGQIEECFKDMKAIGSLNAFLSQYVQKGIVAQQELEDLEEARQAYLEENGGEA